MVSLSPSYYDDFYFRDVDGFVKINQAYPSSTTRPLTPALPKWDNDGWLIENLAPFHELYMRAHDGWVFIGYFGQNLVISQTNIFEYTQAAVFDTIDLSTTVQPPFESTVYKYGNRLVSGIHGVSGFEWKNPLNITNYIGGPTNNHVNPAWIPSDPPLDPNEYSPNRPRCSVAVVTKKTMEAMLRDQYSIPPERTISNFYNVTLTVTPTIFGYSLSTVFPWYQFDTNFITNLKAGVYNHIYIIPPSICNPDSNGLPTKVPTVDEIRFQGDKVASFNYEDPDHPNATQVINVGNSWVDPTYGVGIASIYEYPESIGGDPVNGGLSNQVLQDNTFWNGSFPLPVGERLVWYIQGSSFDVQLEAWCTIEP